MSCRKCTNFFECSILSELKRIKNERQKVLEKKQLRLGQNKEDITQEIIKELKVLREEWLEIRKKQRKCLARRVIIFNKGYYVFTE